jgi:hypothetical protein
MSPGQADDRPRRPCDAGVLSEPTPTTFWGGLRVVLHSLANPVGSSNHDRMTNGYDASLLVADTILHVIIQVHANHEYRFVPF